MVKLDCEKQSIISIIKRVVIIVDVIKLEFSECFIL